MRNIDGTDNVRLDCNRAVGAEGDITVLEVCPRKYLRPTACKLDRLVPEWKLKPDESIVRIGVVLEFLRREAAAAHDALDSAILEIQSREKVAALTPAIVVGHVVARDDAPDCAKWHDIVIGHQDDDAGRGDMMAKPGNRRVLLNEVLE